jgi:hypothetical protein
MIKLILVLPLLPFLVQLHPAFSTATDNNTNGAENNSNE